DGIRDDLVTGVQTCALPICCSGGSYGSIQLADALPGLIDGALIACTFPDPLSIALSGSDGRLLTHYFAVPNPAGFANAQKVAISGYKFSGTDGMLAFVDAARQSGRTDPVPGRAVSRSERRHRWLRPGRELRCHALERRSRRDPAGVPKRTAIRGKRRACVDSAGRHHGYLQRRLRIPLSVDPFRDARAHGRGQ